MIGKNLYKHWLTTAIPLNILGYFPTSCRYVTAKLANWRDTGLMKFRSLRTEKFWIRESGGHVFESEWEKIGVRLRTFEDALRIRFWDECRRKHVKLCHSTELPFHHCISNQKTPKVMPYLSSVEYLCPRTSKPACHPHETASAAPQCRNAIQNYWISFKK